MTESPRYLIVGLGSIGLRHLQNLRALRPKSRIAVLRRPESEDGGKPPECDAVFHSFDEVQAFAPQAAVIASPAPFHVTAARHLIELGAGVLIEKPLSDRLEGTADLLAKARAAGVTAMVGYNLRFEPAASEFRDMLDRGEAGQVMLARGHVGQYLPDWRPGRDYRQGVSARAGLGGGPLLELSHEIDLACWLFGRPDRVRCSGGRYSELEIDVDDAVELALEYDDPRRLVTLGLNFLERAPRREFTAIGSAATVTWDGIGRSICTATSKDRQRRVFPSDDRNAAYLAELKHFLDCVETGTEPLVPVEAGVAVLEVIEAAKLSLRSGNTVPLGRTA